MRLTEVTYDNALPVEGYGPGFFRIDGKVLDGGLLLLPRRTISWDGYGAVSYTHLTLPTTPYV